MDIRELLQKRADLHEKATKFFDEHADKNGYMLESDALQLDRMTNEIEGMTRTIKSYEKLEGWDKEMSKPFNTPHFEPFSNSNGWGEGNDYHKKFLDELRANFRHAQAMLREGELSDGGYLVPMSFNEAIVSKLQEENILRQIGTTITTESTHRIPVVATQPAAQWVGEGDSIDASNMTFSTVTLNSHKLAANLMVTNELLQDSYYNLEDFLTEELGRAFARAEEESFLNGTGTNNQPTGLLTTLAQSATSTLQTTGTNLSADDLITLCYSVDRPYRRAASWLMSDATLSLIRRLKTTDQQYIWEPNFASEDPPKILGYPVYTSSFMPPATSGNTCILFGDFTFVAVAERGNRQVRPLRELYALSDKTAFLCLERVDCALTDRHALRGLKIRQG